MFLINDATLKFVKSIKKRSLFFKIESTNFNLLSIEIVSQKLNRQFLLNVFLDKTHTFFWVSVGYYPIVIFYLKKSNFWSVYQIKFKNLDFYFLNYQTSSVLGTPRNCCFGTIFLLFFTFHYNFEFWE